MTFIKPAVYSALAFALLVPFASADVLDSSPAGFTVKTTLTIQATPSDVYKRLVRDVGEWWNSQHTFSGSAHNLSIQDKPMGCFCEILPGGGGVRHMEVINVAPGKRLVLSGAMGPLQSKALVGTLEIDLSPVEGGTKLEATYSVGGYVAGGLTTWAGIVDGVVADQFTRLKNYVEHGTPAEK